MNLTPKTQQFPIGVDLGASAVKVAQLRQNLNDYELVATGSLEIPRSFRRDPGQRMDFYASAIQDIVRSQPFKGRECILSLPAEATFVNHIQLPKLSPEETTKAVRWEIDGKLPYPSHNAIVRHVVAGDIPGDGEPKQEVIVVAAARATVDAYLKMARRAKIDVVGLGIEGNAIVDCFARHFRRAEDADRTILFVDVGASSTQVVLSRGNRIVFARNLMMGGDHLDKAVADALKIPPEQAIAMRMEQQRMPAPDASQDVYKLLAAPLESLAAELNQCLRYYESIFRGQPIERTIFVGGQAYDKKLCQAVAQKLNLPAQVGDPLLRVRRVSVQGFQTGGDGAVPQPEWAVAVGLSLANMAA